MNRRYPTAYIRCQTSATAEAIAVLPPVGHVAVARALGDETIILEDKAVEALGESAVAGEIIRPLNPPPKRK